MKRWLKWSLPLLALWVLGFGVQRALVARKAEQALATPVAVDRGALELASTDLIVVRPLELTRTLAVSGGLKAVNSAIVKAKVAAEVKALSVREGDAVKAGQVIGQLDTTELEWRVRQAEQTAASSRAQLDIAKRALVNNRALVAQGFISPTGLETSISNEASAQATYEAAAAAVEIARKGRADALLVAPIAGIVSQRLAQPGERVAVDAKLVEIVDLSRIELEAAVAPEDVAEVQVGQPVALSVDGLAQTALGAVVRINPSTQAGTRAVMVYIALQHHPALRQGLFAKGSIALQRKTALVVPASTVRVDQAKPYVLAVIDGKVVQRAVGIGARGDAVFDGRRESAIEIASGVSDGMSLLRATTGPVRDGTPVKVTGSTVPASTASPTTAG
ncbi:MAG: efflux RND transporter periplasmic adaptor subunit [Betaproteobacteria bacterium]|nr:MAG: efflux RND transporter periplasmic adaptor subunit [Betaproteobacteria bacterium]